MKQVILLVEDDFDAIPFAISAISEKFSVYPDENTLIIAKDYDEAMEALDTHPEINIVITDLFFPKQKGSDDISLGLELLDKAEVCTYECLKKEGAPVVDFCRNTLKCIKDARESIHKNPGDQALGILVAKKAMKMGKVAFIVSNIHHHEGHFRAISDLFNSYKFFAFDASTVRRKLRDGFLWKARQVHPKDEDLEFYLILKRSIDEVLKTQFSFWESAVDTLHKLTNPSSHWHEKSALLKLQVRISSRFSRVFLFFIRPLSIIRFFTPSKDS